MNKILIKKLVNLIRKDSDYEINKHDSLFIAERLIELNYCNIY